MLVLAELNRLSESIGELKSKIEGLFAATTAIGTVALICLVSVVPTAYDAGTERVSSALAGSTILVMLETAGALRDVAFEQRQFRRGRGKKSAAGQALSGRTGFF